MTCAATILYAPFLPSNSEEMVRIEMKRRYKGVGAALTWRQWKCVSPFLYSPLIHPCWHVAYYVTRLKDQTARRYVSGVCQASITPLAWVLKLETVVWGRFGCGEQRFVVSCVVGEVQCCCLHGSEVFGRLSSFSWLYIESLWTWWTKVFLLGCTIQLRAFKHCSQV